MCRVSLKAELLRRWLKHVGYHLVLFWAASLRVGSSFVQAED